MVIGPAGGEATDDPFSATTQYRHVPAAGVCEKVEVCPAVPDTSATCAAPVEFVVVLRKMRDFQ